MEEVKQKIAETPKRYQIDEFKNCFEQWKKCFDRCIASNRVFIRLLKFKHVKVNARFFINKLFFGTPLI